MEAMGSTLLTLRVGDRVYGMARPLRTDASSEPRGRRDTSTWSIAPNFVTKGWWISSPTPTHCGSVIRLTCPAVPCLEFSQGWSVSRIRTAAESTLRCFGWADLDRTPSKP